MLGNALPERVDPRLLARDNVALKGTVPLARFERMAAYLCHCRGEVDVQLQFHLGRKERVVILGNLHATVAMECQYCLEEVAIEIDADVDLVVADSDEQVRELSEEREAMLVTGERLPLVELIEDDLILSLPMVARHGEGDCLAKLDYHSEESATEHPFAALAALKEELQGGGAE